jgi:hypothetical protein
MGWKAAWTNPKVRRVVFWAVHILVVLCLLVLLGFVNLHWNLDRLLLSPLPWLHRVWLPVLFVLLYAAGWLAWALWKQTALSLPAQPALDDAWKQAMQALKTANIDLLQTPVVLVFGASPAMSATQLLATSGRPFTINAEYGPFGVCATSEAIYWTLPELSVWSRLCRRMDTATGSPVPQLLGENPSDTTVSAKATDAPSRAEELLLQVRLPQPVDFTADELEQCRIGLIGFLSRLRLARSGRVPVNGCLWLVPWNTTSDVARLESAVIAARVDATTVSETILGDVPQSVVVVGCEHHDGFVELLQHTPVRARAERLYGRSWTPWTNVPAAERPATIRAGLDWIGRSLTPGLRMQFFQQSPVPESAQRAWHWEYEQQSRHDWLARWIGEGLFADRQHPMTLLGLYYAGTGTEANERGFLNPVLNELLLQQNTVSWHDEALASDRRAIRLASTVLVLLSIALILVVWYGWWVLTH